MAGLVASLVVVGRIWEGSVSGGGGRGEEHDRDLLRDLLFRLDFLLFLLGVAVCDVVLSPPGLCVVGMVEVESSFGGCASISSL